MLTATNDGRLLTVSGVAAATAPEIEVQLPGGSPALVTDNDGSHVAITGGGGGVLHLDLTGLSVAGAAVEWTLTGPDGTVAALKAACNRTASR